MVKSGSFSLWQIEVGWTCDGETDHGGIDRLYPKPIIGSKGSILGTKGGWSTVEEAARCGVRKVPTKYEKVAKQSGCPAA